MSARVFFNIASDILRERLKALKAILFDMDGTLTVPVIDFPGIRRELCLPEGENLLESIAAMSHDQRERAFRTVYNAEDRAAAIAQPGEGALELLTWLKARGIGVGIITRNRLEASEATLERLGIEVEVLVTRENGPPKPDPFPATRALHSLGVAPEQALTVGDFKDDITCGAAAGTLTCMVTNGAPPDPDVKDTDFFIQTLRDLQDQLMKSRG